MLVLAVLALAPVHGHPDAPDFARTCVACEVSQRALNPSYPPAVLHERSAVHRLLPPAEPEEAPERADTDRSVSVRAPPAHS